MNHKELLILYFWWKKQGAWGQMVLNNILTNNLGFREGHEYLTQESYNTEEGNLQPDVNHKLSRWKMYDSRLKSKLNSI